MKLFLVVLVIFAVANGSNTPHTFQEGKKSGIDIEAFIVGAIESFKPRLAAGIPEINLPPLDPFKLDRYDFHTSLIGLTLKAQATDIVAHGASDFKIEHLKVDMDKKFTAKVKIMFPKLEFTAEYNTRGSRILLFPIRGRGKIATSLYEVTVTANLVAAPVTKDGGEILQVESLTTQVVVASANINVTPYRFIGKPAAFFINSHPAKVMKILAPTIDKQTASLIKEYLDSMLASMPIKDVLPES